MLEVTTRAPESLKTNIQATINTPFFAIGKEYCAVVGTVAGVAHTNKINEIPKTALEEIYENPNCQPNSCSKYWSLEGIGPSIPGVDASNWNNSAHETIVYSLKADPDILVVCHRVSFY